jgi:hypothetical protein
MNCSQPVCVSSRCVKATGTTRWSTNELPAQLVFPRGSGIFFHHLKDTCPTYDRFKLPGEPSMAQDPFAVPLIRYARIATLLRYKATHYRHLTHVDMEDSFGAIGYWPWERTALSFPGVIQDLVREQAVALLIEITYPNPNSSMTFYREIHLRKRHGSHPWED